MITSIRLQRFKGHRDTLVPLGRLTVLVGPNGTGKTSVLQALGLVARLVVERPETVFSGDFSPQDLLTREEQGPVTLTVAGQDDSHPWDVTLRFAGPQTRDAQPVVIDWSDALSTGQVANPFSSLGGRLLAATGIEFHSRVSPAVLYHFDAGRIAAAAYSIEENPSIDANGSNTAVVLAALKLEREEIFERIEMHLRKIVPIIERIRIRRVKMHEARPNLPKEPRIGNKIFIDFKGARDVPAHGASEGTLVTLALLTALFNPRHPRIILLDDIDQSLHPQAQMALMEELKQLLILFPEVQIVATTHSPYILDALDPSDVRVFAPRADGSVACRSLSEHPQAEQARGSLTAGQLWSLDPEWRWVVGER